MKHFTVINDLVTRYSPVFKEIDERAMLIEFNHIQHGLSGLRQNIHINATLDKPDHCMQ